MRDYWNIPFVNILVAYGLWATLWFWLIFVRKNQMSLRLLLLIVASFALLFAWTGRDLLAHLSNPPH